MKDKIIDRIHNHYVRKEIRNLTRGGLKPFWEIGIETQNMCNGSCSFCPVNKHADPRKHQFMEGHTFQKIMDDLQAMNYDEIITFNVNNEPLLDGFRLPSMLEVARLKCPKARLQMYTNGTLLDQNKLDVLMKNLDKLVIDFYGRAGRFPQLNAIIRPEYREKIVLSYIDADAVRTSRAGQSRNKSAEPGLVSPCIYPWSMITVRPDGGVNQCCNDALGVTTMGNVHDNTLMEIWEGDEFHRLRCQLLSSRQCNPLCKKCDVFLVFPDWMKKLKGAF